MKLRILLSFAMGCLLFASCGGDSKNEPYQPVTPGNTSVAVTNVFVSKSALTLKKGGTESLAVTITPANATNKGVTWKSDNSQVAVVDSNGNVSAVGAGETILTVTTSDGNKVATVKVTVVMDKQAEQRTALMELFNSTGGVKWIRKDNWGTDKPLSEWYGVKVENGEVVELNLSKNNLDGELKFELSNLPSIKVMEMDENKIRGAIPDDFGKTKTEGGETRVNLQYLEELNLSKNEFNGEIPKNLFNIASLKSLVLGKNELEGDIPSEVGNLTELKELDLSENNLTGNLPEEMANLTLLEVLSIFGNKLSGDIPTEILQSIWPHLIAEPDLAQQLGFTLTADDPRVREILIEFYKSTGGEKWKENYGWNTKEPLVSWKGVEYSHGKLIALNLEDNNLSGKIPESIGELKDLVYLNFRNNTLSGSIPKSIDSLASLECLDLSVNQLSGSIPSTIGNLSNLIILELVDNQLTGSIPESIGNLKNLRGLNLSYNKLSGSIPKSLGKLSNLEYLAFWDNKLSGRIPNELMNLSKLKELVLGYNQLTGNIPVNIDKLANLEVLDLGSNQLTGNIPASIGNMSKLIKISFWSNQLSGSIPKEMGNLSNLKYLVLTYNQLTGSIPESFKNLNNLNAFHIEYNCLSGPIPKAVYQSYWWYHAEEVTWQNQNEGYGLTLGE